MIADLCDWVFRLATSWLPPLPFGGADEAAGPGRPEDGEPAPATAAALARAREALSRIENGASGTAVRPALDARFRRGAAGGVDRLVARLDELDPAALARSERERLLGAARSLVARLER